MNTIQRRLKRGVSVVVATACASASAVVLGSASAQAVVGDPAVVTTAPGTTSVPVTTGKSRGSGLWGYVGDVDTRRSGVTNYNYGLAFNPVDQSLWVTDSGKIFYFGGSSWQAGSPAVLRFAQTSTDWSVGQYTGDGVWAAEPASGNAGIGANYANLADAQRQGGTGTTQGALQGPRGISFTANGTAVISDPDAMYNGSGADKHFVRTWSDINTQSGSFGLGGPWPAAKNPGYLDYPVGVATLKNGNILVTSQTADRVEEYTPDGVWVRSVLQDRPVSEDPTNGRYRAPYALGVDPVDGSYYVGYVGSGTLGHFSEDGTFLREVGKGFLPAVAGNPGTTFAIAVDPVTQDVYVGPSSATAYVLDKSGAPKGRFSGFGEGATNGRVSTIRGIAFDKRGFMHLTVSEGTSNNRVQIFARTPDPVQNLSAVVTGTTATLRWDGLASGVTADAQSPLRDYVVETSTDDGATWTVVPTSTDTNNQVQVPVAANTLPRFRVSAWNEAGNGDPAVAQARAALATMLRPDTRTTGHNTAITVDVLSNDDQSPALAPGTLVLLDGTTEVNELTVNGGTYRVVEGKIRFTPTTGFAGMAAPVTYRVTNAEGRTSHTTVQVNVLPAGLPPVSKKQPVLTTRTSQARVTPGTPLADRVTLTNFAEGHGARGVATLYGPFKSRAAARCTPTNVAGKVTFTPKRGTITTPSITVRQPGWYTWVARSTADSANKAATHKCGLRSETTLVAKKSYQPPQVEAGYSGTLAERRAGGSPALRVQVPSLGIDAATSVAGVTAGAMALPNDVAQVARLNLSARPGDRVGTTVLAGHVSDRSDRPGALFRLTSARKGTIIKVRTARGVLRYRVTRVGSQPRTQALPKRLFSTTSAERLVLISCTGKVTSGRKFHYTRNVYVEARRIK